MERIVDPHRGGSCQSRTAAPWSSMVTTRPAPPTYALKLDRTLESAAIWQMHWVAIRGNGAPPRPVATMSGRRDSRRADR